MVMSTPRVNVTGFGALFVAGTAEPGHVRLTCLTGAVGSAVMATTDEIDDALECGDCNSVLEGHLEDCVPRECAVVAAW